MSTTEAEALVIREYKEHDLRLSSMSRPRPIRYQITAANCWECVSHARVGGYPVIKRYGEHAKMHRYVYELENGPIPLGMVIMHSCDNPACINPAHLKLGTEQDNIQDKVAKKRHPHGETNGMAKVTADAVRKIRADTRKVSEIAREYGLHWCTVDRIQKRKIWKHV